MKNITKICFSVLSAFLLATGVPLLAMGAAAGPDDDEFLEFTPPIECFSTWFGPEASALGQASCGKKLVRFQLDNINMQLQQFAQILGFGRTAAREAGFDLAPGMELDLTAKMNEKIQSEIADDPKLGQQNVSVEIKKFILKRGQDKTIEEVVYQVWKVQGTMAGNFGGQPSTDSVEIVVAINEGTENTTRVLEMTGSFGEGSFDLKGVVVTKSADGANVSLNVNFTMEDSGGAFVCSNPEDPETCERDESIDFNFEQTVALSQAFDSSGNDSGKIQWTESGSGQGAPPPPDEQGFEGGVDQGPPPGGSFNNTMTGGWDATGAGCLEMKQDFDAIFEADDSFAGGGGAHCGPFVDGDKKCEYYKKGREFAAILKVEDSDNSNFSGCDPETGVCGGGGFDCGNTTKTNNCDDTCPDGLPQTPPDPAVAANNTDAQAWLMGCFEGLRFQDSSVEAGFGGSARKGECWDANGLVATASGGYDFSNRDDRIDSKFDHRDNFDNDRDVSFEEHGVKCAMTFDDTKKVELKPDGSEFCVPDAFASNNSAKPSTPLCSATDPSSNPCE